MSRRRSLKISFLPVCVCVALMLSCGSYEHPPKYPNMIADLAPFPVGSANASLDRFFSNQVKEAEIAVIFHPRLNEVSLEFRHELLNCRQFWNEAGRKQFIEAKDSYNADFEGKNLVGKYSKSRAAYGKCTGRFEWETFKYSTTYHSLPTLELGYRFKGDAVYFTVLQRSAREVSNIPGNIDMESMQFPIYFTRAQAEKLAELFDQNYLLEQLNNEAPSNSSDDEKDIYQL